MSKFYARFKESKEEIIAFPTQEQRDDWVNFNDEFSLAMNNNAEDTTFQRIALTKKQAEYIIKTRHLTETEPEYPMGENITVFTTEKENLEMSNKKTNKTNIDNNNSILFNMIMRNLRPVSKYTASIEIPLSLCFVDERYQKLRKHKNIKKLYENWDERKLSPIIIVPHPEENRFAIVDGQARFNVATKKELENLPSIVLLGTEEMTPEERLIFEATYFIGQDSEVDKIKEIEKHPAKLIQGDKPAWDIENVLNKYNLEIEDNHNSTKSRKVGSYTHTYSIAKRHGYDCLDFIFSILEESKWTEEKSGLTHFNTRMLDGMWEYYPTMRKDIHDFLCKELKNTSPTLFQSRARAAYPEREPRVAIVLYCQDVVCDKMNIKHKEIAFDGKRFCKAS